MSPILQAMKDLLSDGLPHAKEDLHKCCGPSSIQVVKQHIYRLREYLPPGEAIVPVIRGRNVFYQHVRLLHSANDGRR